MKETTIAARASELLKNGKVTVRVKELQKGLEKRTEVTVDRVVKELAKLAFTDLPGIVILKRGGIGLSMTVTEFEMLTAAQRACIRKVKAYSQVVGEDERVMERVEVELYDKMKALDMLGRHLGMFGSDAGNNEAPVVYNFNMGNR